jgi:hypothetical protein
MRRRTLLTLGIALVLALIAAGSIQIFAGSKASAAEESIDSAATVEAVDGQDVSRITLTRLAARRIDLQTDTVSGAKAAAKSIPYSALLYDDQGRTWVYVSQKPLVFVRAPVEVVSINGPRVVLSSGPAVGTRVATVGAAELYGTEFEITDE